MNYKNILYWAMIIFLAVIFVMGGVGKLAQMEVWQERFVNQWNLPAWLAPIPGVAEILGGLMLLIPRLTTLGAAVIVMVMLGATGTHIMAAEWPRIGVTLVFGTMAGIIVKWSLLRVKAAAEAGAAEN